MFSEVERPDLFNGFVKNAICLRYDKAPVYFLLAARGDAMEIHIAIKGREGKKNIRKASRAVLPWIYKQYPWCEMIIAPVANKSVYNLCINVGFVDVGEAEFEKGRATVMVA